MRFLERETEWRNRRSRVPAADLLQEALEETGYLTAAAAGPHGDQVVANLEKLVERAQRRRGECGGSVEEFALELRKLLRNPPREAQAELLDGADPNAVQLLTVHQAKGLEWPLVVVADLSAPRLRRNGRVAFERGRGLALKSAGGTLEMGTSPRFREVIVRPEPTA